MFTHARGILIAVPWILWLGVADLIICLLLPLKLVAPDLVYDWSSAVAETVWHSIQLVFETLNGARITFSGDELPRGESAIVLCNHVGWADFYMIQALALKAGMLSRQRYLAKIELLKVPFLGWGLWAMGFPLMSRNWIRDEAELRRSFAGIVERGWPTWLISFSEATRFTAEKYAQSQAWCNETGRRQPKNLLYPRAKGFVATVKHLRKAEQVKAVYVLTVAYRRRGDFQVDAVPTIWDTLSIPHLTDVEGFRFHVNAKRFELAALPHGEDELAAWLEDRWVEKGEWLAEMEEKFMV